MPNNEDNFQTGLKHYFELVKTEQDLGKEYTRLLWTFAGAALALSITIISSPLGDNMNTCKELLIVSWVLLILCIIFNLISLKCSQKSFQKEIEQVIYDLGTKSELSSVTSTG